MSSEEQQPYRVLARKYRSQSFSELIGQEALVQTLTNAIQSGRIAQAYMLTGIRGVGKTSTARLIAKALNYKDGPTAGPTDDCPICQAITLDRHPDVIEMDAASRTGIDDIREIIDGVRYAPTEARYKVYIIDEVHMLSKQAFNALLKTLEEPPPHVVFIFATTEIRKVPITILSRCQRFDLRRVDQATLQAHYKKIAELETVQVEPEALTMIARAADGSVRDGLSLLDQAIAMSDGNITAPQVRDMLGLADQNKTTDLLEHILHGRIKDALALSDDLYKSGGQAAVIAEDLLGQIHLLTRVRAIGSMGQDAVITPETLKRLETMAGDLSMPTLARSWQILLKGLGEIQHAPQPQAALDMILIRLSYTADLPDPAELIKKLKADGMGPSGNTGGMHLAGGTAATSPAAVRALRDDTATLAIAAQPAPLGDARSLEDITALLEQNGKFQLVAQVRQYVRLVHLEGVQLECALEPHAPATLPHDLTQTLRALTGQRWLIILSTGNDGAETLLVQKQKAVRAEINAAAEHPVIKDILQMFDGAEIKRIYTEET
ncbi:MAG: DNA polymerase III subunit gamma/tau [Rhodospirillales bacterium]|nr:DNA polymerase III subunit gamma/tau [Rhodospirillales bacterium]